MSSSAHHHDQTSEPSLWPPVTAALILIAAADLPVYYGAVRLSEAVTHHTRPPWAPLGPWLLALLSAATLIGDPLARTERTTLLITAIYAPCFGYSLYQAIAVYTPGLAHTAARLL